jgi:Ni/Fe-hydrogenase 1 B-type cytochrome subunit
MSPASTNAVAQAPQVRSVYVYEAPVRLWHWINALAIVVLALSGYFIGKPLPSVPGEASASLCDGLYPLRPLRRRLRAGRRAARARLLGAGGQPPCARAVHAADHCAPPTGARSSRCWPGTLFLRPRPNQYVGHNPMARLAMFFGYLLLTLFMIFDRLRAVQRRRRKGIGTTRCSAG